MSDDFASQIDALLADVKDESSRTGTVDAGSARSGMNSFSMTGAEEKKGNGVPVNKSVHTVDLSVKSFPEVTELTSEFPTDIFDDKSYYKTALTGENQSAQRLHQVLSKYLTCQDPKDRTVFRQQIISAYWELVRGMAPKMADVNLPKPKRMLLRFGVLLPSLFRPEQKQFFSKIFYENRLGEPIFMLMNGSWKLHLDVFLTL